jgi:hypothetical protein
LRAKLFEWQVFWQEVSRVHAENLCQENQFAIWHPAQLCFELADRAEADTPALQLELLGEDGLRPSLAVAEFPHLGADHVQTELHQAVTLPQATMDFYSHMRIKNRFPLYFPGNRLKPRTDLFKKANLVNLTRL